MNYKKINLLSFKVEDCLLNIIKKVKHQFFFNEEDFRYIKTRHSFHLVDPSPWPLTSALGAFMLTTGGVLYMHKFIGGDRLLLTGLFVILYSMYTWWRDVIREATFEDQHTFAVQRGLRLGMILFIVSEIMFFFAFFWAFFHSSLAPVFNIGGVWPPENISPIQTSGIPLTNTFLLLSSGATVTWAHHAIIVRAKRQAIVGLIFTLILAVLFTSLQGLEYIEAPFCISDSIFGSCFYMATGFHGFHVFIGTLSLFVSLLRIVVNHFTPTHHFGFESAAWYWHFVDVVWLFLFISVYWWGGMIPSDISGVEALNLEMGIPQNITRGSVLRWFGIDLLPNFTLLWQVFSIADTILLILANVIFLLYWLTNKTKNEFFNHFLGFLKDLTKTEKLKLMLFTILFGIPNKIWVNNNISPFVAYFAGLFVCLLGLYVYPLFLFCYIMYIWVIVFSYVFAYSYETFPQFSSYINKFLFGEPDSPFAQVYFNFFWGNMMNGAKKLAPPAGVVLGSAFAIQKKREEEQAKAIEYSQREAEQQVQLTGKKFTNREDLDAFKHLKRDEYVEKFGLVTKSEVTVKKLVDSIYTWPTS